METHRVELEGGVRGMAWRGMLGARLAEVDLRGRVIAATLAGLAAACAGPSGPAGAVEAQGAGGLQDGLQTGLWTYSYPNGQREAQGGYLRDERAGLWTHWYEDGALRMRGEYQGERQVGLWEFWHPNGRLSCRGEYVDGREEGEWTFWFPSGALQQRGCFERGRRALEWVEYDAEGALVARGSYVDDRPIGAWTCAAPDGTLEERSYPLPPGLQYVREVWPGGAVRREGCTRDGRPSGLWLTRHANGAPRARVTFAAGRPSGELALWRADGEPLARGPLAQAAADGPMLVAGDWLVRGEAGLAPRAVRAEPRAPWDRRWSDATIVDTAPPLAVAVRWLAELEAPLEVQPTPAAPVSVAAPESVTEPAPTPRLEAPTDPGHWTVREARELELLRRYYRDGWLPRRHTTGARYGVAAGAPRLGAGDDALADGLIGQRLPTTSFPTATGGTLDLQDLRGKRVLLVVLRGFTSQVCVYCFAQTTELAPLVPRFRALDCEVVVLFPGARSRMEAFVEACREEFGEAAAPYRMVYDPELDLARALGLEGNLARPAAFVLDAEGVVRHAYIAEDEQNVADRPPASDLLRWVADTP
ncbi:MAG: redoxin domain-containing protein [Planctomycetota bacterium]